MGTARRRPVRARIREGTFRRKHGWNTDSRSGAGFPGRRTSRRLAGCRVRSRTCCGRTSSRGAPCVCRTGRGTARRGACGPQPSGFLLGRSGQLELGRRRGLRNARKTIGTARRATLRRSPARRRAIGSPRVAPARTSGPTGTLSPSVAPRTDRSPSRWSACWKRRLRRQRSIRRASLGRCSRTPNTCFRKPRRRR